MEFQTEKIEIDLPKDIIFAMRGLEKPEEIKKKLKVALAILLFQEGTISLGKAIDLCEMSRTRFVGLLREYGLPAYEYSERDVERDQRMVAKYRESIAK
jgi:predicted HTH domain antitoxin